MGDDGLDGLDGRCSLQWALQHAKVVSFFEPGGRTICLAIQSVALAAVADSRGSPRSAQSTAEDGLHFKMACIATRLEFRLGLHRVSWSTVK